MAINTYIIIVTLNVNSLNAPIKRHKLSELIRKQALAGVAQWIEYRPTNHKVPRLIPSQGTCPGCRAGPCS